MYEPLFAALDSSATVVTANNRLARSLSEAYGRQRLLAGDRAWVSPDVLSWNAWLAKLWEHSRLSAGQASQRQLLSDTDASVLWAGVAADDSRGLGMPLGAGVAQQAWQLLWEWQALDGPEWAASGLSPDQQVFLRWSGEYRNRLAAGNWLDAAQLPAMLLIDTEDGLFDQVGSVVFAGFDVWSPAKRAILDTLRSRGVAVTVAAEQAAVATAVARVPCENAAAELQQAARWSRARAEASPEQVTGVIVRDLDARAAEVRRVFMDIFCPDWRTRPSHTLPVNFSYGGPLNMQPRISAALNLLSLATGEQGYQSISLALRTAFVRGGRAEAGVRAELDLRLRDKLGAEIALPDARYYARELAPVFAELLEVLEHEGKSGSHALSFWADHFAGVLQRLGWPGEETLDSHAFQELEAWHELLRNYAAATKVQGPLDARAALALLERLAAGRLHQPESGPGAVQVMGVLEAAGHQFDHLWVTGMAAEDWPQPANPNPLLPFDLQRRCAIPGSSPAREIDYAMAVTSRLRVSAAEVLFSWPAYRDGEPLHPSGLVADLPVNEEPEVWQEATWAMGMLASADQELLQNDRPRDWPAGVTARGGANLFRLQASCPLRAVLELRLGASDVEPPVTGLGYKERGIVAHNVLEKFYTRHRNLTAIRSLDETTLNTELAELIAAELRKLPGSSQPFMGAIGDLELQRLLPLLLQFVALDRQRGDFTVLQVEESNPNVAVGPLILRLTLDRLDQLANGDLLVIDYKTGQVAKKDWNPANPGNMQLPLYATFTDKNIRGVAFAQVSAHGVKYEGLADESVDLDGLDSPGKTRTRLRDSSGEKLADWDSLTDEWRATLLRLAERFAAGDNSINPRRPGDAEGQFAVLTRIYDMPGVALDEEVGDG